MKELIKKHKNKLLIASPLLVLSMILFGAFYILARTSTAPVEDERVVARRNIALEQFNNLDIKAKAFIVYDASQNKVITSKNASSQLPLASITKIMSAVVALELAPKDKIINVSDRVGLVSGDWRLDDLLRLTLVASSNSGIITISDALSAPNFVELMNARAKTLGLRQTYFLNESGLDMNDTLAGAYGSAVDVATLFNYALKTDPDVFGATRYDSVVINSVDGRTESAMNTNANVSRIQNLVASKTGFTELAGGNLVIAFDIDSNTRVIVAVLGSTQEDRFTDAEALARAALAYYSLI